MGRGSTSSLAGSAVFGLECDRELSDLMTDTHLVWFGAKLLIRKAGPGESSQGRTRDVVCSILLNNGDEGVNAVSSVDDNMTLMTLYC